MLALGLWLATAAAGDTAIGWRTDTTGCYPDATPPLHWAPNQNVAWVTPLPGKSCSTPLVLGGKLILTADPYQLLCVDQADGKILWRRENDVEKVAPQEDVEALGKKDALRVQRAAEVAELKAQVAALAEKLKAAPADAALKEQRAELEKKLGPLERQLALLPGPKAIKPNGTVGYSCCTPVSDGTLVVALYNNGMLVCYDLAGKLQWARLIHRVGRGYGQSMSPALAGQVVGVHMDDAMFGVDLRTGKTLWEDYELQHQGSPIGFRVGGADVFLTCEGRVRRAQDGQELLKLGGALNLFSTPALHKDTAYWISENRRLAICRFLPKGADGIEAQMGGRGIPKGVYYASVLVSGGYIYLWNNAPPAPPDDPKKKSPKMLHVLDEKTGKSVQDVPLAGGGWAYPSPTAAGGFIYVAGDAGVCTVFAPPRPSAEMPPSAKAPKLELREIAKNTLEPFGACPVFDQDRMYVRGQKNLYCIRASEADKKEAGEWKLKE